LGAVVAVKHLPKDTSLRHGGDLAPASSADAVGASGQGNVALSTPRVSLPRPSVSGPRAPAIGRDAGDAALSRIAARLDNHVQTMFSLDLRSVAALRIGLALMLLADLTLRSRDLVAHYTDQGVLPRAAQQLNTGLSSQLSVHALSGSVVAQALLFLVAGAFAVLLLLGYRTRLVSVVSLGLLISLNNRNPIVDSGADQLLLVMLCWSIFLPSGARFSLDSLRRGPGLAPPRRVCHVGTIGYVIQLALVYLSAALAKNGADWRSDGTAIYYALSLGQFSTPLGEWLRSVPGLSRLLTPAVLGIEFLAPLLLIAPVWTTPMRIVGVLSLIGMQAGFGLTLANLGLFPMISAVVLLGLLPSWFWDRVVPSAWARVCAPMAAAGAQCTRLWTAGALVAAQTWRRVPRLRQSARQLLALSGDTPARRQGDRPWQLDDFLTAAAMVSLLYVVLMNIGGVPGSVYRLPDRVAAVGRLVGLAQHWDMFAPTVPRDSGWYVIPGTLRSGEQVDVYRQGAPLGWERPESIAGTYPNHRWFKYLEQTRRQAWLLPLYADYLCSRWNGSHAEEQRLARLEIVYMGEWTPPDYQEPTSRPTELFKQDCP
jgi:hypothetical protein